MRRAAGWEGKRLRCSYAAMCIEQTAESGPSRGRYRVAAGELRLAGSLGSRVANRSLAPRKMSELEDALFCSSSASMRRSMDAAAPRALGHGDWISTTRARSRMILWGHSIFNGGAGAGRRARVCLASGCISAGSMKASHQRSEVMVSGC